jgi:hypothetical protein
MRLRVMELPAEVVGEFVKTPFALIVDRCGDEEIDVWTSEMADNAKTSTGACAVLVFSDEVELND